MTGIRWNVSLLTGFALACFFALAARAGEPKVEGGIALLTAPKTESRIPGWLMFSEEGEVKTSRTWILGKDGVLVCKGNPPGYLYTGTSYADFTLSLEWRWPPGGTAGKGGVLLRMRGQHRIWPCSLEAQLNAGAAGDFWALGGFEMGGPAERMKTVTHPRFGPLRNLPRRAGTEKPVGEWNRLEIVAKGGVVIVRMNGEEVNRAEGCETQAGPILLTAEGSEIHFRNVMLRTDDSPVQ